MEDLYPHPEGLDKSRFVVGLYHEPSKKLAFLKLVNSNSFAPLVYEFMNIDEIGNWNILDLPNDSFRGGDAKISLEEVAEIDTGLKQKIQNIKDQVFNGPVWNKKLYLSAKSQYESAIV